MNSPRDYLTATSDADLDVNCPVCLYVAKNPVICAHCEKIACAECVASLRKCPLCRVRVAFVKLRKAEALLFGRALLECQCGAFLRAD